MHAVLPASSQSWGSDHDGGRRLPRARTASQVRKVLHVAGRDSVLLPFPRIHRHLRLVQRVRDEAHRFAIQGHRRRRARRHQESILETVPGLGPAKRRRHCCITSAACRECVRAGVADLAQVARNRRYAGAGSSMITCIRVPEAENDALEPAQLTDLAADLRDSAGRGVVLSAVSLVGQGCGHPVRCRRDHRFAGWLLRTQAWRSPAALALSSIRWRTSSSWRWRWCCW